MIRIAVQGSGHQGRCVADDHALPAEALAKQVISLIGDPHAVTGSAGKEGWRPRPPPDRLQVPTNVGQGLWHLVLRKVLDQAQQFVTLRTHGLSLEQDPFIVVHDGASWCIPDVGFGVQRMTKPITLSDARHRRHTSSFMIKPTRYPHRTSQHDGKRSLMMVTAIR